MIRWVTVLSLVAASWAGVGALPAQAQFFAVRTPRFAAEFGRPRVDPFFRFPRDPFFPRPDPFRFRRPRFVLRYVYDPAQGTFVLRYVPWWYQSSFPEY